MICLGRNARFSCSLSLRLARPELGFGLDLGFDLGLGGHRYALRIVRVGMLPRHPPMLTVIVALPTSTKRALSGVVRRCRRARWYRLVLGGSQMGWVGTDGVPREMWRWCMGGIVV